MLLVEFLHSPPFSFSFFLLFAFQEVFFFEKYLHRKSSINLIKPLVDEDINKRMGYIEIKEKLGPINVNLE